MANLGRSATDANRALVDAILALPAKLDPRAPALTALPTSDRACALPPLARAIDRLFAEPAAGSAGRKRRVPAPPKASLPSLLAAYAILRRRRRDHRRRTILVLNSGDAQAQA